MQSVAVLPSSVSLLRCPSCRARLAAGERRLETSARELRCPGCGAAYPVLLGIPLLVERPQEWIERWSEGLGRFIAQMNFSERQLLVELLEGDLSERSRGRVSRVVEGLGRHRSEVISLFQHVGIEPKEAPAERAGSFSPETYFTLIHRDYGWAPEVDEVGVSWARLRRVLPEGYQPGATLVLGAGTGRLAWQFAAEFEPAAPILALDVNPLPFLITALLLQGQKVLLTELPAHPRRSTMAMSTRELLCPLAPTPHLGLVLADGLEPPVESGTFDTVVTPWFVDQVPADAARIPALANSLLRDGGSFVCTGPFLYDAGHTKPSLRYCADEFIELVERAGFVVTAATYETEPYVASPLSTQGRIEHVLYLHARKVTSEIALPGSDLPAYLLRGAGAGLPIPRPQGIEGETFSPAAVAEVAALIDGHRSVLQVTDALVQRGILADDGTADAAVRGCLKVILRQVGAL